MRELKIFYFACNAILPIVLLVLVGYFLRKIKLLNDEFLNIGNKLVFKVLLPCLLFFNIAFIEKDAFNRMNWNLMLYAFISILALFFIGIIIVKLFVKDNKQKGVVLQCLFRSNYALIGIPLCEFLATGTDGKGLASIMAALSVPLFNMLAVIALSIFDKQEGNKIDFKKMLKKIITNPLIVGVFVGLIFLAFRQGIIAMGVNFSMDIIEENFLYKALVNIKNMATPLALIVLGGKFQFQAIKRLAPQIILGTSLRTIFVPALCLVVAYFLGFRENEFPVLVALFSTPVAVSSVPMAQEMNQDGELAGQFVVWTSITSIFSLFIIVMILASIGIFIV